MARSLRLDNPIRGVVAQVCPIGQGEVVEPTLLVQGMQTREWAVDLGGRLLVAFVVDEGPMEPLTPDVIAADEDFIQSMKVTTQP